MRKYPIVVVMVIALIVASFFAQIIQGQCPVP